MKKYKYIIYTRFDQYHTDVHPRIVNDEILIPEGEDYSGICDRHVAFPKNIAGNFWEFVNIFLIVNRYRQVGHLSIANQHLKTT